MVGTKQYAKGGCIPKPFKNCAKITTSMMTWTFLWQKLFRILWQSHFIFFQFSRILDEEELCPANYFRDFMLLNEIQNWTMKNFCQKRFHLIFSVSYVNSTEVNGSAVVLPVDDLAENKWKTKNFPTSTKTFGIPWPNSKDRHKPR